MGGEDTETRPSPGRACRPARGWRSMVEGDLAISSQDAHGHCSCHRCLTATPTGTCCLAHWPHCPDRWAGSGRGLRAALSGMEPGFRPGATVRGREDAESVLVSCLRVEPPPSPPPLHFQGHVLVSMELLSALLLGF